MTNRMQSIETDTNRSNEVFEPGFSNEVDKKIRSVSDYHSQALNSENGLNVMHLNICSYGAYIHELHSLFDNTKYNLSSCFRSK